MPINNIILERIGLKIIAKIQERTLQGIDANSNKFKAYSTRPFKMPIAPPFITAIKKLSNLKSNLKAKFFKKDGENWVVIMGGYAQLKATQKPNWKNPNLTLSGSMMNALAVTLVGDNSIRIGFTDKKEEEKMKWNIAKGRDPMGLPDDEIKKILEDFGAKELVKDLIIFRDGATL